MTTVNNLGGIMNVKKSLLFLLIVPLLFFLYSCGGGSGSGYNPSGTGSGEVSKVELSPTQYRAQTNGCINIYARVIDGDGAYLSNVPVTFTNLSSIGQILNKCGGRQGTSSTTDSNGLAKVALYSTTPGFATMQAEVNKGSGKVRDKKTVYFSIYDLTLPVPPTPPSPYLVLEASDYNLLENPGDNQVIITATVFDGYDNPVTNSTVTFGADVGYKTSPTGSCSDGSATCEVTFPLGNTKTTDLNGQASVLVEVDPAILRTLKTNLNITAEADNGAANMLTLNLEPVTVKTISVFANPQTVASGGTSTITAYVTTTAGTPVPDNTTVNFTANKGGVDPFAQTTNGIAEATFTAPTLDAGALDQTATIKAKVGTKEGSVNVTVTAPPAPPVTPTPPAALAINPPTASSIVGICATFTFTITGGTPLYTTSSSNINRAFNDNGAGVGGIAGDCVRNGSELGIWSGSSITVTVPAQPGGTATAGTVDLNVSDSGRRDS